MRVPSDYRLARHVTTREMVNGVNLAAITPHVIFERTVLRRPDDRASVCGSVRVMASLCRTRSSSVHFGSVKFRYARINAVLSAGSSVLTTQ